jgi:uncharacterized protein (TIGR02466 family)
MNKTFVMEHNFWPTPCYTTVIDSFYTSDLDKTIYNQKLVNFINDIKLKQNNRQLSNRGGWQSDLLNTKETILNPLITKIVDVCLGLPLDLKNVSIDQIWANINKKHDYNVIHSHGGKYTISGTYYVKAPKNCGKIIFRDPRPGAMLNTLFNKKYDKGEFRFFDPTDGMLILFPSFLEHFVEPNLSEEDRISISFDIIDS